ncbi:MAG TPA: glycosyltransferase family 39 protein [Gemmatimonadaceae bacterium]
MTDRRAGPRARHPGSLVLATIVLGSALRLLLAATIGMSVDESYETTIARTLSLGYYDHPPLSFWIPGVLARVAGTERGVVLRLPFIALFAGTTWLTYRIGARAFGERAGAYGAILLNLAPVFAIAVGGWVLPDGPLDFALLAAVLCLVHVLLGRTRAPIRWWVGAGAAAGVAALSKYHAVFLPAGVALYLLGRGEVRRWLRTPGPWIAGVLAALGALPAVVWNAHHGWASFRFQLGRGAGEGGVHPVALLESLGGQAGYLLPWLWVPLVWVLLSALRRGPRDAPRWLLASLAIPPIALFTIVSSGGKPGLPHWPMPGYLMLFPLLGAEVDERLARGDRRVRRWLAASAAGFGVVLALAWSQAATGWMARAFPALFRQGDPTLEVVNWSDARPAILALAGDGARQRFVAATSWIDAAKAGYALGPGTQVLCLCRSPHHFGYLHDQREYLGRDAILLDQTRGPSDAPRRYAPYFAGIDALGTVTVRRAGHPALDIAVFVGRRFRAPVPDDLPR